MTRTDSLAMWRRVAEGDDDVEVRAWMQRVAAQVVAADSVPDAVRAGTIVAATGLAGRHDANAELRELVQLVEEFAIIEGGAARAARRGERMSALIKVARRAGLADDLETDDELRKRIDRVLKR